MWRTAVGKVRAVGIAEGTSYLLLMFIAMPLKYFAGRPEAVQVLGSIHGALFVIYAIVTLWAVAQRKLKFKFALLAAAASLIPIGPFLIDKTLAQVDSESPSASADKSSQKTDLPAT
ncbi:MAG: DUF3817 domain-containing protein [Gemmataceae bacterium]